MPELNTHIEHLRATVDLISARVNVQHQKQLDASFAIRTLEYRVHDLQHALRATFALHHRNVPAQITDLHDFTHAAIEDLTETARAINHRLVLLEQARDLWPNQP